MKKALRSLIVLFVLSLALAAASARAYTNADYDAVFDWAEGEYPYLFSPAHTASQTISGYYVRYYQNTGVYLGTGVSAGGTHLYVLIPGPGLIDLGDFSVYYALMRAAATAVPSSTLKIIPLQVNCIAKLPCNQQIATASGGTPPYHFQSDTFANGAPPLGTIIDLNGYLSGTPSTVGSNTVGVCVVDLVGSQACKQTNVTVLNLSGTWSGSWSKTGTGDGGCTYSDSGSLTLGFTANGAAVSGSASATGLQLRYVPSCEFAWYTSASGSLSGSISGNTLDLNYSLTISETNKATAFHWTATLKDNKLTGTLVSSSGAQGSFSLSRQ